MIRQVFTSLKKRRKTLGIVLLIIALAIPLPCIWGKRYVIKRELRELVVETKRYARKVWNGVPSGYAENSCGCTKHHLNFKKDKYDLHRSAAKTLASGDIISSHNELKNSSNMVKVTNGIGYAVATAKLTHSEPYLHKKAYSVLKEIGAEFDKKLKGTKAEGSKFKISSLTRTTKQQKELSRRNRNATKGTSAHSYGAAFDIYSIEGASGCSIARKELNEILVNYQKEGKLLLCPEGGCIHITVQ